MAGPEVRKIRGAAHTEQAGSAAITAHCCCQAAAGCLATPRCIPRPPIARPHPPTAITTHRRGPDHLPPPPTLPPTRLRSCRGKKGGGRGSEDAEGRHQEDNGVAWVQDAMSARAVYDTQVPPLVPSLPAPSAVPLTHRMARRPEAASPSSTRTPSPGCAGLAPAPAAPALAAFWKRLRASPLSISVSRCAMKYFSTAGGSRWSERGRVG